MNTLRRLSVAIALAAMSGAACSGRVSQLTAELGSADEKTCESAAKALGALGPGAAEAASAMLDVIVKQRRGLGPTCWMTVVDELPKLGPSVTSLLLTALGDQRAQDAAYVLASMGPSVLPAVTGALVAPTTAEGAAAAIAMLGPAGAPALPQLRQARRSNVLSEPRFLATISWSRSDETVADFVAALSSLDPEVRAMAARALKDFVRRSPEAVAALARALESQDDELRSTAVHALTEAGPAGAMAVPSLIKSLQDPVPAVRSGAAAVLANIGPAAGAALPDLRLAADRGLIPGFVAQSAIRNIQSR